MSSLLDIVREIMIVRDRLALLVLKQQGQFIDRAFYLFLNGLPNAVLNVLADLGIFDHEFQGSL